MRKLSKKTEYTSPRNDGAVSTALLMALLTSTAATPSSAQENPDLRKSRMLEEVLVTAQKRSENNQDVPISVTAFNSDTLDALGVSNPQDLQRVTPGLTYTTTQGASIIYLRGVGSDAYLMADPSVALYIDNVYFPFAQGLAQSFGAIESIEVLKGPQGTLFGRNAVGGAINIHSKSPGQEPEASIQFAYESYNTQSARFYGSYPFTDKLAGSVSAFKNRSEPYYDGSIDNGKPIGDDESDGIRVKLRFDISDTLQLNLAGFTYSGSGPGSLLTPNVEPSGAYGAVLPTEDGYYVELDAPVDQELENEVYYASLEWALRPFDVKLLASEQHIDISYATDFDGTSRPIISFIAENQLADVSTAELQILSNNDSWGSDWLSWIVGAYYFESTQGYDPVILQMLDLDLASGTLAGVTLPSEFLAPLLGAVGSTNVTPNGNMALHSLIGTESIASFFQVTAELNEWASLTLGARYQDEFRQVIKSGSEFQTLDGGGYTLADYSDGRNDTTYSFKPKVSLNIHPFNDREFLLYLSYQEALKSGTYNVVTLYDEPDYVQPEELTAYEIGIKSEWLDGLLRLNVAAFQYEQVNQQVQFVSTFQGGAVSFENAGGSEVDGFDFDATAQLLPTLINDLILTLSGAYLNGQFTDYTNARGYDEDTGMVFEDGDYTGHVIPRTPEWTAALGLNKSFFFDHSVIEIGTDVYYNGGFYYLPQNTEASYQEEYHVLNARISYLYEPWNLRVTAFGNNLEDKKYSDGLFQTDFGVQRHLAKPVSYGLKVNWDLN
tara:strand:+ start:103 stop:2439 length:2337 start_codon:yes stop_codon:yes gene_type:complete